MQCDAEQEPFGKLRRTTFKGVRRVSPNMLGLAVGQFARVANQSDSAARPSTVWALPTAQSADATFPARVLSAAVPAWEDFTQQPLQELGKVDMLIWNGEYQWSTSHFGLLQMDPFRTLWNADIRCGAVFAS